jgi:PAS domain S-box-containing protein
MSLAPRLAADEASSGAAAPHNEFAILDRLPVGVLIYRLEQLLYANRAFLAWTGHENLASLDDAGGLQSLFIESEFNAADTANGSLLSISSERRDQGPVEARLLTIPWDGEKSLALVLVPQAGVDRIAAADVASEQAQRTVAELTQMLDAAADGVVVVDARGQILSASQGAGKLFGSAAPELVGRDFFDLLTPEHTPLARDCLARLARGEIARVDGREVIAMPRDDSAGRPLTMTMVRLDGEAQKFCAVFRDITEWKKTEAVLTEAKRRAEHDSLAKSEFLARISHEIRTPLNAIIGFSELMTEERFGPVGNERYQAYLKDIHTSGSHVISLINDLLDLAKIEAGKLDLTFEGVALNEITQQCVAIMQPQANRERIIIRTSLSPKLPQVLADARSVRQIVLNLLSNSIKYTGAGGQVIVSTAIADDGGVVLHVRDSGAGMSEAEIAIALEPFRQLATSPHSAAGGTGLGLPVSKALAEANHAMLTISSAPNAGTLVDVTFPPSRLLTA